MGSVKTGLESRIGQNKEQGDEITRMGQEKVQEAQESKSALDSISAVDDDTQQAVEQAGNQSREIASNIAESDIRTPTDSIRGSLDEVSGEATDYASKESDNAGKAGGMTGDFSSVGGSLASQFEQSASDFQSLATNAESTAEQIQQSNEALASQLEGMF